MQPSPLDQLAAARQLPPIHDPRDSFPGAGHDIPIEATLPYDGLEHQLLPAHAGSAAMHGAAIETAQAFPEAQESLVPGALKRDLYSHLAAINEHRSYLNGPVAIDYFTENHLVLLPPGAGQRFDPAQQAETLKNLMAMPNDMRQPLLDTIRQRIEMYANNLGGDVALALELNPHVTVGSTVSVERSGEPDASGRRQPYIETGWTVKDLLADGTIEVTKPHGEQELVKYIPAASLLELNR